MQTKLKFKRGLYDGIPIALGYLSVSFAFGMMASNGGLPVWASIVISMTNLTSAGQIAGLGLILSSSSFIEMALTQLTINIRYSLMSLSVAQKFDNKITFLDRFLISFGITDEIFALSCSQKEDLPKRYMYGLILMPYIGWALGTTIGALAGQALPESICSALNIMIYGMFIAIIIPPAKKSAPVIKVLILSVVISCLFHWVPFINRVSSGFVIIISTVISACFGAIFFPIDVDKEGGKTNE